MVRCIIIYKRTKGLPYQNEIQTMLIINKEKEIGEDRSIGLAKRGSKRLKVSSLEEWSKREGRPQTSPHTRGQV